MKPSVSVVIPVHNGGKIWTDILEAVRRQSALIEELIILDIESTDQTKKEAEQYGASVIPIFSKDWDPWYTRQWAASQAKKGDIIVYLNQNSLLIHSDAIENLVETMSKKKGTMAYGRQQCLSTEPENIRYLYNYFYPRHSTTDKEIRERLSLAFYSCIHYHAFSAYNKKELLELNRDLPRTNISGEDLFVIENFLRHNQIVSYCPNAAVVRLIQHSLKQQFQQSFDRGLMHQKEGHGLSSETPKKTSLKKFYSAEKRRLLSRGQYKQLLYAYTSRAARKLGYFLGENNHILSKKWAKRLRGKRIFGF